MDPAEHEQFLAAVSDSGGLAPAGVAAAGGGLRLQPRRGGDRRTAGAGDPHPAPGATLAEAAGVTLLLLEPLNTRIDHPGMFLNDTQLALDIIEAVDSPRLQLLFDVYHSMVMEGDGGGARRQNASGGACR